MFDKLWNVKSEQSCDEVRKLSAETRLPEFMADTLFQRGLKTKEDVDFFLYGTAGELRDPYLFTDMEKAVSRIIEAVEKNEHITIYGDYDADGIDATAILYRFFKDEMGAVRLSWYIPDRFNDGYGLSIKTVDILKERGTDLIVTVDCGITSTEEAKYIKESGIDLVVTDHHRPGTELPEAVAVIDPSCSESGYPFAGLCGAGVAFKLAQALSQKLGKKFNIDAYLPFATIATIGDSVPLCDENRILVKSGLSLMAKPEFNAIPGLVRLFEVSEKARALNTQGIAYGIVPTINAAGRMGSGERALKLILSKDDNEINELTKELIDENKNRQTVEADVTKEASKDENIFTKPTDSIVISVGHGWHSGVIGIVASKLVEKFNKPSIVCVYEDDGITVHGSARSVQGFNIHEALAGCEEILDRFGGHKMAAGLSLKEDKLQQLVDGLNKYAEEHDISAYTLPTIDAECVIPLSEINIDNAERLTVIEPCGEGNKEPIYIAENLQLVKCKTVGADNNHLSIQFNIKENADDRFGITVFGIAFSAGKYYSLVSQIKSCDIAFKLMVNEWNNQRSVSLIILDIRAHGSYNIQCSRERLVVLYNAIKKRFSDGFSYENIGSLYEMIASVNPGYSHFEFFRGLEIFEELGFIKHSGNNFKPVENPKNNDLENSPVFMAMTEHIKEKS